MKLNKITNKAMGFTKNGLYSLYRSTNLPVSLTISFIAWILVNLVNKSDVSKITTVE